jgi:hypothetical protein
MRASISFSLRVEMAVLERIFRSGTCAVTTISSTASRSTSSAKSTLAGASALTFTFRLWRMKPSATTSSVCSPGGRPSSV